MNVTLCLWVDSRSLQVPHRRRQVLPPTRTGRGVHFGYCWCLWKNCCFLWTGKTKRSRSVQCWTQARASTIPFLLYTRHYGTSCSEQRDRPENPFLFIFLKKKPAVTALLLKKEKKQRKPECDNDFSHFSPFLEHVPRCGVHPSRTARSWRWRENEEINSNWLQALRHCNILKWRWRRPSFFFWSSFQNSLLDMQI